MGVSVVWFKRDLRIEDHTPLVLASNLGSVIPLYIVEPSVWMADDFDPIHGQFILESLTDLKSRLRAIGADLLVLIGETVETFEALRKRYGFTHIFSHEETGNGLTFERDLNVQKWCRFHRIEWTEVPTNGVVRRLKNRDGWAKEWERRMAEPILPAPSQLVCPSDLESRSPRLSEIGLTNSRNVEQRGGEHQALATLDDFLSRRGKWFSGGISSPNSAFTAGSRLSPYLSFGNLSSKQVVQATRKRILSLEDEPDGAKWKRSLRSFDERLHWRCHFVQKLESEPEIENENFMRSLNGLREGQVDPSLLNAWSTGNTGWPMVDACMRCLMVTGWLNFRMRAMIAAIGAYQLWLHWKPMALFTAKAWLDYEPGIHYSQFQMQSGTTGINTLRIYSPIKQSQDHDPEGKFIRRWLPELAGVPTAWIHQPWLMPDELQDSIGVRIGKHYPSPVVDHLVSVAEAKRKISEFKRARPEFWEEARSVQVRHGSRRKTSMGQRPKAQKKPSEQMSLDLFD
jgi:deoxyribodipyrimidine photo-lyase